MLSVIPAPDSVVFPAEVNLPSASTVNVDTPELEPYVPADTLVAASSEAPTTPVCICRSLYGPDTSPEKDVAVVRSSLASWSQVDS